MDPQTPSRTDRRALVVAIVLSTVVAAGVVVAVVTVLGRGAAPAVAASGTTTSVAVDHDMMDMDDPPRPVRDLTPEESADLAVQLAAAAAAVPGPTAADATAAGFVPNGREVSSERHMVRTGADLGTFDPASPPMLLVNDTADQVLALVYWVDDDAVPGGGPPEGFAGPSDQWHHHGAACEIDGEVVHRDEYPPDRCRSDGGTVATEGGYMLHVWVVPGRENPRGVFAVSP